MLYIVLSIVGIVALVTWLILRKSRSQEKVYILSEEDCNAMVAEYNYLMSKPKKRKTVAKKKTVTKKKVGKKDATSRKKK